MRFITFSCFLLPFRRKHQEAAETAVQQLDREHDCPPCGQNVADRWFRHPQVPAAPLRHRVGVVAPLLLPDSAPADRQERRSSCAEKLQQLRSPGMKCLSEENMNNLKKTILKSLSMSPKISESGPSPGSWSVDIFTDPDPSFKKCYRKPWFPQFCTYLNNFWD